MNHTYRLVWHAATQQYRPAAEATPCHGKTNNRKTLKRLRAAVLAASLAGTHLGSATAAPTGGVVTAGQGTIHQTGTTTTVIQQSQNLAVNWLGFNIGSQETVRFVQPSSSAIALNRVTGTDASEIYGHLLANGQVFLLNPNGVLFGHGAQVNVGGLVASSLDLSDGDFLAGHYNFHSSSDTPERVVNRGTITAATGGSVALLGGQVSNQGTISARLGSIALAAGTAMTLDLPETGLMSVRVDQGAVAALAENRQLIQADGGRVIMTAAARDALLSTVVNNSGVIEARTVFKHGGEISLLSSPESGTVQVDGTLDASAPTGGSGGSIETSGRRVMIADTAHVTTAAPLGTPGTWLIDPTDYTIAPSGGDITGAALSANLQNGNVTILSSQGSAAGNGDINVNDAVSWSANTVLTLNAARDIQINSNITASGDGAGLNLAYGAGRDYHLNLGAQVTLSGKTPSLNIGGQPYTVINSVGVDGDTSSTTLQGIQNDLTGNYALGGNINASATAKWSSLGGFAPLGYDSGNPATTFTGQFHGLGHTITAITIANIDQVGLFGIVASGAVIRDVGIATGSVNAIGTSCAGGLAAENFGSIRNSFSDATVIGADYIGGLVGLNYGTITQSHTSRAVRGNNYVGGLVGENEAGATITASYSVGQVHGDGNATGGLVGWNAGSVDRSYSTASVGNGSAVGGLVGYNSGNTNEPVGIISNSYAAGFILGGANSGPLGGLIGTNYGTVNYSYAAVRFIGTSGGGFIGLDHGTTTQSYWTSATATGDSSQAVGLTSAQAELGSSYAGWDFNTTWRIYEGHTTPLLKTFLTPLTITANNVSAVYSGSTSSAVLSNPVYSIPSAGTSTHLQGVTTPYGNARNAGSHAPDLWSDQQGYDISLVNAILTITPAPLTITAQSVSKTYDGTPYSGGNGVTYTGFVGSDTSSVLGGALTYSGTSQGAVNVGSYTIIPGGLTSTNYTISFVNGDLEITRAALVASAIGLGTLRDERVENTSTLPSGTGVDSNL